METSKEIIEQAKQRFKDLEHKNFDWRSFFNGYLEAQAKQLIITDVLKSLPTKDVIDYLERQEDFYIEEDEIANRFYNAALRDTKYFIKKREA